MRIVHLLFSLDLGGIETMIVDIANAQSTLGHKVFLVVVNNEISEERVSEIKPEVTLIRIGRTPGSRNSLKILKLASTLFYLRPDVIHAHWANLLKLIPTLLLKKTCFTLHKPWDNEDPKAMRLAAKVFGISDGVTNSIKAGTGIDAVTVYNGTKTERIKVKEQYSPSDKLKVLQLGRLSEEKGHLTTIAAAKILKDRGYNEFCIDFIGDGPLAKEIKAEVLNCGLEQHIHLKGRMPLSYVYETLCEYDLLIQPSIWEGFGLTIVEAMAAKTAVAISSLPGPDEIIDHGKCGYLFEPNNAHKLADIIELFFNKENDMTMIDVAYKRARTMFDITVTACKYIEEYKRFLQR